MGYCAVIAASSYADVRLGATPCREERMQAPAVSSAELTPQSAALPTRSLRPSWGQRLWQLLSRNFESCGDVPPETFATDDYLLLSGRVTPVPSGRAERPLFVNRCGHPLSGWPSGN